MDVKPKPFGRLTPMSYWKKKLNMDLQVLGIWIKIEKKPAQDVDTIFSFLSQ